MEINIRVTLKSDRPGSRIHCRIIGGVSELRGVQFGDGGTIAICGRLFKITSFAIPADSLQSSETFALQADEVADQPGAGQLENFASRIRLRRGESFIDFVDLAGGGL